MLQQASVRWLADRANGWYIYHASIRHSSRQMYFFCFLLRCPPSTNIFDYLYEYGSSWVHVGPWTLWAPWAHGPMGPMGSMGLCDKAQGLGPSLLASDLSKNTSWQKLTCPICGDCVILLIFVQTSKRILVCRSRLVGGGHVLEVRDRKYSLGSICIDRLWDIFP